MFHLTSDPHKFHSPRAIPKRARKHNLTKWVGRKAVSWRGMVNSIKDRNHASPPYRGFLALTRTLPKLELRSRVLKETVGLMRTWEQRPKFQTWGTVLKVKQRRQIWFWQAGFRLVSFYGHPSTVDYLIPETSSPRGSVRPQTDCSRPPRSSSIRKLAREIGAWNVRVKGVGCLTPGSLPRL